MAKKRKKKRAKYPHVIKTDYLVALSDKLHQMNPTKEIIFNTLKDVYSTGYTCGYSRKHEEVVRFRQKKELHFNEEWNKFKDEIDDEIHKKSNENKTT